MMKEKFELLAPAGSFDILKAVIEAGADAVYVGGELFGARAYANNFSQEELLEAIDYVHLRGKQLFLTVNTLLKNDEIYNGLYEYLLPFYERGLDAVIVQDLGVLTFIKEHFPSLAIHTSTQMTVTGVEGALFLKNMGASRVVLARELSIQEMQQIQSATGLEIEVFVHGALCYSYSGQCLFSSLLGGRSGNRGRCAQPCRLSYAVLDEKHKVCKKDSYILSLKDLCGVEYLERLADAGVYSLKIEGRMKQASYAAGVVATYRKCIDSEGEVSRKDMQNLLDMGNRCGFTNTYFTKRNDESMVTYVKPSYEKSNQSLHDEIERTYVGKKSQIPVDGRMEVLKDKPLKLLVSTMTGESVTVFGPVVSEARNKPLTHADVDERMHKTGESAFYFSSLEIALEDGVFVPNGMLNQLRRDALDAITERMLGSFKRTDANPKDLDRKNRNDASFEKVQIVCTCESREQLEVVLRQENVSDIYIDAQMIEKKDYVNHLSEVIQVIHAVGKKVFLRLPAIFRGSTARFYRNIIESVKTLPLDGWVVRNYEEIQFLKDYNMDTQIVADYNLYTYNDYAKDALFAYANITSRTIPLELNQKEILNQDNTQSEIVVYGYYPLMITASCVHKNATSCDKTECISFLKDRQNVLFPVRNYCKECYNIIYNSVPTILITEMKRLEKANISRFRLDFTVENKKEVADVFRILEGNDVSLAYTKGHYKRGVE